MSATRAQNSCQAKSVAGIVPKNKSAAGNLCRKVTLLTGRTKGEKGPPRKLKER